MRLPLVVLGLALALSGPSCGPVEGPTQVVLVVCDTLRADHLSTYGYDRPTSPVLTELAEGATLYRRFQASAPWTPVSYTHLRAHETEADLVCRLLLEKKKITIIYNYLNISI